MEVTNCKAMPGGRTRFFFSDVSPFGFESYLDIEEDGTIIDSTYERGSKPIMEQVKAATKYLEGSKNE